MDAQQFLSLFAPTMYIGAASAVADLYFTPTWKPPIIAILCVGLAMTYKAKFYLPLFFRYFGLVIWADSITEFVATPYAIQIFLQIWRHTQGYDTDDSFLEHATVAEYNLIAYFFANGTIRMLWLLWNFKGLAAMSAIFVTFVWKLLSESARDYTIQLVLITLLHGFQRFNIEKCSIRYVFLAFYEPMMENLSRWEKDSIQDKEKETPYPSKYEYTPLQTEPERTIRLLRLDWRIRFSELICSLSTCQIDKAPIYEAVSYTWGKPPPTIPLLVDGKSLLIMPSVERFLWNSRSFGEPKYFWIDAICINQNDNEEKTNQLPLMQDIYGRASRIIVWLDSPSSSAIIDDLRFALRFLANETFTGMDTMTIFQRHFGSEKENAPFQALHRFFSHPWFERIWILQEVAMGNIIHVKYGRMCVSWPCVERAAQTILSNRVVYGRLSSSSIASYEMDMEPTEDVTDEIDSILVPNILIMSEFRSRVLRKEYRSLAQVLYITKSAFKSTDPRDKIFAVLGISTASRLNFTPDYSKTPQEIFEEITRVLLLEPDWHLILSSAGRGYPAGEFNASLPSWVPDFFGPTYSGSGFADSRGPIVDWQNKFSPDTKGGVKLTLDPHIISVQGVNFDVLRHVGPHSIFQNPTRATYRNMSLALESSDMGKYITLLFGKITSWYIASRSLARNHSLASETSQSLSDEEFWATCMSDSLDKSPEYLKESREAWEELFLCEQEGFLELCGRKEKGWMNRIMKGNFSRTVTGKSFAITSKGAMALVPPGARAGDFCVWLRGALMPFLLREGTEGRFEVVGTCYVHKVEDVYKGDEGEWSEYLLE